MGYDGILHVLCRYGYRYWGNTQQHSDEECHWTLIDRKRSLAFHTVCFTFTTYVSKWKKSSFWLWVYWLQIQRGITEFPYWRLPIMNLFPIAGKVIGYCWGNSHVTSKLVRWIGQVRQYLNLPWVIDKAMPLCWDYNRLIISFPILWCFSVITRRYLALIYRMRECW